LVATRNGRIPTGPIAHRRASDRATHDLGVHLRSAALLAGKFAAELAALWHDLGKYAAEFQAMITAADPGRASRTRSGWFAKPGQSIQRRCALGGQAVPW